MLRRYGPKHLIRTFGSRARLSPFYKLQVQEYLEVQVKLQVQVQEYLQVQVQEYLQVISSSSRIFTSYKFKFILQR